MEEISHNRLSCGPDLLWKMLSIEKCFKDNYIDTNLLNNTSPIFEYV